MSDITGDISNRLSIQVPGYDSRMNLGTPDPGVPSGSSAFGYTGFSVHSNFNFFMDIGRVGLYQSNQGSCWQVGGKWLQWSNLDMFMASTTNTTVGADNKVVLASGAGQGQVTALTAAMDPFEGPRLVDYNNLQLHWRVDAVQVALKQFFYGYGNLDKEKRMLFYPANIPTGGSSPDSNGVPGWRTNAKLPKANQKHFHENDTDHLGDAAPGADDPPDPFNKVPSANRYPGGFLKDVEDFLLAADKQSVKTDLLWGYEWEGDRLDTSGGFGVSSYFAMFEPFDPYPPTPFTNVGWTGVASKIYAAVQQVLNWIRRTVDVMRRLLGALTTDNPIWGKRISSFLQLAQDKQDFLYACSNLRMHDFQRWYQNGTIKESDVLASHGGDFGIGPDNVGHAEASQSIAASPAVVGSGPGGWSLPSGSTLTVSDDTYSLTVTFTPGGFLNAADLALALSGQPDSQTPARWVSPPAWQAPPGAPPGSPVVSPAQGWSITSDASTLTLTQNTAGSSSHLKVTGSTPSGADESLAQTIFGFYPAPEAWGQAATSQSDTDADTQRSRDIAFGSIPEDIRNELRPLYNACQDISTALGDEMSMVSDVLQTVVGQLQPPSMIGLIGKDGISMGTNGPLYGAGGGISFIATGKHVEANNPKDNPTESDRKKYLPGLEQVVNWALDGDDVKIGGDQAAKSFQPDSDVKQAMRGQFRVAAETNIVMTAQARLLQVSLGDTLLLSRGETTIGATGVPTASPPVSGKLTLQSFTDIVDVLGKEIHIGAVPQSAATGADAPKQLPTTQVKVVASDAVSLVTAKKADGTGNGTRLDVTPSAINLGAMSADGAFVDSAELSLFLSQADGGFAQLGVWDQQGQGDFFGLSVPKSGNSDVIGKSTASLSVRNGAGVQADQSNVTVTGGFKVGAVLLVKADGTFTPAAAKRMKDGEKIVPLMNKLKGEYTGIITTAKAQRKAFDTAQSSGGPTDASRKQLRASFDKHSAKIAEARSKEIDRVDIGWKAADEDLFSPIAPPDPTSGS